MWLEFIFSSMNLPKWTTPGILGQSTVSSNHWTIKFSDLMMVMKPHLLLYHWCIKVHVTSNSDITSCYHGYWWCNWIQRHIQWIRLNPHLDQVQTHEWLECRTWCEGRREAQWEETGKHLQAKLRAEKNHDAILFYDSSTAVCFLTHTHTHRTKPFHVKSHVSS